MTVNTGITNIAKQKLLNVLCGASASASTGYLGLATAMPSSVDPTLANITEVTTPGYGRQAITWGGATFPAPVFDQNSVAVTFGPVTADMSTGANYAFLCDQTSAGALAAPTSLAVGTLPAAPTQNAPSTATTTGTWAAGTYYIKVTAINAAGESLPSGEQTITTTGSTSTVTANWTSVGGATGYNIYVGTASGGENVYVAAGAVTTLLMSAKPVTAGTPPVQGNWGATGYAPTGAYFYTVTALNAQGETVSSNEVSNTVAANGRVELGWSAVTAGTGGAVSYNVYRATVSGQENVLVNASPLATTTFIDTGALGTSQTPPSVTTAPFGNVWYVWALNSPALALNGNPITVPITGLTIQ